MQVTSHISIILVSMVLTGWRDPIDLGARLDQDDALEIFQLDNTLRHIEVENITCGDPSWMESNSFYPRGNLYTDYINLQQYLLEQQVQHSYNIPGINQAEQIR